MFCETFEKINTDINIKNKKINKNNKNNKFYKDIKNMNEIQSDFIIFNPSTNNNNNNVFMNRLRARSVFYNLK